MTAWCFRPALAFLEILALVVTLIAGPPLASPARAAGSPAEQVTSSLKGGGPSQSSSSGSRGVLSEIVDALESGGRMLVDVLRPEPAASVENPRWNSLESPRQTLMTFHESMKYVARGHDEAWPRALAALGVDDDPEGVNRTRARRLAATLQRLGDIEPFMIAGTKTVERKGFTRYELFPRGVEHIWVWERLGGAPAGSIVLVQGSDGRWTFSQETVLGIGELYESMKDLPPRYEEPNEFAFSSLFVPTVDDTVWWAWLVLLGGLFGGFLAAMAIRRGFSALAGKVEQAGHERLAAPLRAFGGPLAVLVFTVALGAGLMFIHLDGALDRLRWGVLELLLFGGIGWLLIEVVDLLLIRARTATLAKNQRLNSMAITVAHRALKAALIVLFVVFALQNVFDLELGAVIAGLGIAGLAASLAAQDSIKNLFGALTIFAYKPFVVGDWIEFEGHLGEVRDLGMQAARIRLLTGEVLTVPNMQFITREVENLSAREFIRGELDIAISYHTPPPKVRRALELLDEILRSEAIASEGLFRLDERPPHVSFNEFGSYYLNLRVYYWYFMGKEGVAPQRDVERGWFSYLSHRSEVNRRIHERFMNEGIEFAFPTRTLEVTNDPTRSLEARVIEGRRHGTLGTS